MRHPDDEEDGGMNCVGNVDSQKRTALPRYDDMKRVRVSSLAKDELSLGSEVECTRVEACVGAAEQNLQEDCPASADTVETRHYEQGLVDTNTNREAHHTGVENKSEEEATTTGSVAASREPQAASETRDRHAEALEFLMATYKGINQSSRLNQI
jgi:hypothetical protein